MGRFSVEEFKAVLDVAGGIAKPNRFFVSFVPPAGLGQIGREFGNKIEYFCEAVNLPGYQMMTAEARRYSYGPAEKRPFNGAPSPLQMTIIGDGRGQLWKFFHAWHNFIYDHDFQSGIHPDRVNNATLSSIAPYELRYRQDYVVDVAIFHLPETYEDTQNFDMMTNRTICFEAFPSNILDMQLNWADNNNVSRFGVQFEYLDFITTKQTAEETAATSPTQLSI